MFVRIAAILLITTTAVWLSGCGLAVADNSAPLTVWDNFAVIKDGQAYRSAQLDATSIRLVVDTYGIKTIVNLRGENSDAPWYQAERTAAEEAGAKLVDVSMSASHLPSREILLQIYDTFTTADYPILIHCQAGADRTGAAAAIWRMMQGDAREAAASELSLLHGHFITAHPEMDYLVSIFQPDRAWIENTYSATKP